MKQLWHVAVFEYSRNVFKKSFFIVIVSVPLMVAFTIGLGLYMESRQENPLPVGYVDLAGVMPDTSQSSASGFMQATETTLREGYLAYAQEQDAQVALKQGEIQAYFVLPADYWQNRAIDVVYQKRPKESTWWKFFNFLQLNLLNDRPTEVANRLSVGAMVTIRSMDGRRQVSRGGPTFGMLMPFFVTLAFLFLLLISSGYMQGAVSEEKENRTIEVLVTSVSPGRLMAGKVLGIVATSLTLLLAWTIFVVVGLLIATQAGIGWFSNPALDGRSILASVAIAIPAYVMASALMIAIGALVTTNQEAQSVSAIFIMLHLLPAYLSWIFVKSPQHPLAVLFSILPVTALVTTGTRNLFTIVPAWQVAISVVVQTACALAAIGLAGRSLRSGLLRYGQQLNWRALLKFPRPGSGIARSPSSGGRGERDQGVG